MNFTTKVKTELLEDIPSARHCRIAELGGIVRSLGKISDEDNHLEIFSDNNLVIKKAEKLLKKIFPVQYCKDNLRYKAFGERIGENSLYP